MKKYRKAQKYRSFNRRRSKRAVSLLQAKNLHRGRVRTSSRGGVPPEPKPILAPKDLRLLGNPEDCLRFFRELRDESRAIRTNHKKAYVYMSLARVKQIDYAAISVLIALNDHFRWKRVVMRTKLPTHKGCFDALVQAGYRNNLFDEFGRRFEPSKSSDQIFFEKGSGELSEAESGKISALIKHVIEHLGLDRKRLLPLRSIILEICGNSIEWSGVKSKQWLLGVNYETEPIRAVFTATDVGIGILEELEEQYEDEIKVRLGLTDRPTILMHAFEKKYSSSSNESNRNKGLPSIKKNFDKGNISELIVLTNNVILNFESPSASRTLRSARFKGTLYQWTIYPRTTS